MGGHWGTSSSASSRSTVRASQVADALENWTYSTSPSDRDAVVRRLSAAFPEADVRRGDGSTAHDAVVDDVRVLIVSRLDSAFRRDFYTLTDRFDDVVVFSTTCHASTPNEWREFKHRNRGHRAGARVRFAHRRDSSEGDGPSAVRTLAGLAVPAVGIVALLAASLGLFGTGGSAVAALEGHARTVGTIAVLAAVLTITVLLTRRRICASVLRRIPHT